MGLDKESSMHQCHDVYPTAGYGISRARPVAGAQCHDPEYRDGDWYVEGVLADSVRDWAERLAPGDEHTVQAGIDAARHAFEKGASVPEACEKARTLVLSRLRHPSHPSRSRPYAAAS